MVKHTPLSRSGTASRNEHVPKMEIYVRTVKKRVRAIAASLPFKRYLPRLIAAMV